ncbi:hypothetical protein [Streptomyces sp. NPDC096013]|uniref:hypothetical protein n=1 Tax=Streptomyces sp. NPDC096013 TaxID=3366069 RepID=UPI003825D283
MFPTDTFEGTITTRRCGLLGSNRQMKERLWRLRSNRLRRRDDIVEAWIVLVV